MKKIYCTAFIALTSLVGCCSEKNVESSLNKENNSTSLLNLYGVNSIEWIDLFNAKENEYYAYIYSLTCYYCNMVKEKVNLLANCSDIPLYFVKYNDSIPVKSDYQNTIGCNYINDLYIVGTPTLFIIKDAAIYDCYVGYNMVKDYIDSILDIH